MFQVISAAMASHTKALAAAAIAALVLQQVRQGVHISSQPEGSLSGRYQQKQQQQLVTACIALVVASNGWVVYP